MATTVKCKLPLYADDRILLVLDKDPKVISDTLPRNVDTCNNWLLDNRLSLHLEKTEAMICGTKCKIKNKAGSEVKCKDTTIKTTTEVKYLGVKLDDTPSGKEILDTVEKKCTCRIKCLNRQARCFPRALKRPSVNHILMVCCYVADS